jgi:hypothetical protein
MFHHFSSYSVLTRWFSSVHSGAGSEPSLNQMAKQSVTLCPDKIWYCGKQENQRANMVLAMGMRWDACPMQRMLSNSRGGGPREDQPRRRHLTGGWNDRRR